MERNFERSLALVLKHEGGYVDHPRDPGGATNLGVTLDTLSSWQGRIATKSEVRALTVPQVAPIYRRRYWDAVEGDDLPSGLDYAVFDFAVNSGVSRAARYLQAVLGVPQDGKIGPVTVAAAKAADTARVIETLCANRLKFLRDLSTFDTFGKGWTSRVNGVLEDALLMAVAPTPPIPDVPTYPQPTPTPSMSPSNIKGHIGIILGLIALGLVIVGLTQFTDFI
jgi:lysozyme family protein